MLTTLPNRFSVPANHFFPTRGDDKQSLRRSIAQTSSQSRALLLIGCLAFIAIVSAHDTWLAVDNEEIMRVEKNPICLALIQLEPERFTFFVLGKSIGTLTVISVLTLLIRSSYRYASQVTISIAAFQFCLLIYLHLSDPLIDGWPNPLLLFQ